MSENLPKQDRGATSAPQPVRGPLALTVSTSSPLVSAGSDFSIFVVVRNPFDVPVTLYEVQTHVPVDLVDVNRALLRHAEEQHPSPHGLFSSLRRKLRRRSVILDSESGYAVAVGTDYSPEETAAGIRSSMEVKNVAKGAQVAGIALNFPKNPTLEELDAILLRSVGISQGVIPIHLAPGDEVVRQFRLRTRRWLFFTPLTHSFQIQGRFAVDDRDHNCAVTFTATIRARLASIIVGGLGGALLGATLKSLTQPDSAANFGGYLQATLVALLATLAVVVGFARKTGSQSFVSIEDFWGGFLIGFSVGFLGYSQFANLLMP